MTLLTVQCVEWLAMLNCQCWCCWCFSATLCPQYPQLGAVCLSVSVCLCMSVCLSSRIVLDVSVLHYVLSTHSLVLN